jgi:hypothetical protein
MSVALPELPARRVAASNLTTYREGSLHATLKASYAATLAGARVEAAVDGYVVDIAGDDEIVEIQTGSFASARRKLERLLAGHRIVLVHPIAMEKRIVLVDGDGVVVRRRRSPKRGRPLDLFEPLVHLPGILAHPGFRLELVLTSEDEIRGPIPDGVRYRHARTWWRLDRRLVEVLETIRIDTPADLLRLLPSGMPDPFTTSDLVAAAGCSKRLAMRAVYSLERSAAIERVARRGRFVVYRTLPGSAAGPTTGARPDRSSSQPT